MDSCRFCHRPDSPLNPFVGHPACKCPPTPVHAACLEDLVHRRQFNCPTCQTMYIRYRDGLRLITETMYGTTHEFTVDDQMRFHGDNIVSKGNVVISATRYEHGTKVT